jgi:hypothetical protein
MRPAIRFSTLAVLLCAATPVSARVTTDHSLALPDRFVQARLDGWVALQAQDGAVPDTSAASEPRPAVDPVAATEEGHETSRGRKILFGAVLVIGFEALLALPSTAAYVDEDGKTLAAVDGGFAALSVITPSASRGETIGAAVGVLALAGTVLAIGDDRSKDEMFFINWAGLNVAIFGGRWIGGLFSR